MSHTGHTDQGLLVTNHLNLMFSLAAGLIMPPSGFGDKYYRDTLRKYPGWIPLFVNKVPRSAINTSVEEAKHLMPVIAEVDLEQLDGKRLDEARKAQQRLFSYPENEDSRPARYGLLVRGPIPAVKILQIRVRSTDDLSRFQLQSQLRSNVPESYPLKVKKTLFSRSLKRWKWKPEVEWPNENKDVPIHTVQAAGGILAMLHQIRRKGGAPAAEVCRIAFSPQSGNCDIPGLTDWMDRGHVVPASKSVEGHFLWSVVELIAKNRMGCSDNDLDDLILEFFKRVPVELRHRTAPPLTNTLQGIGELGGGTIRQLLQCHQSPFGRAMVLFFLRRRCEELLEFENDQMTEMDWVHAAILFGARSGWLRLPLTLREGKVMESAVSYRMAAFYHRLAETGVDLGEMPEMPPLDITV